MMISWLWRLGLIALLTWFAVPLIMREDTPVAVPDTVGAEVVDSALNAWQRFWAERTPVSPNQSPAVAFSTGTMPNALASLLGEQNIEGIEGSALLNLLQRLPRGQQLSVAQLQQRAQDMGFELEAADAEQLLAWLEAQTPN
ncbi:hypothetical protein ACFOSD_09810 [Salinispirillum marinum]|uniref:DUF2388 domain-containing protein n=2 Tax=Saccharospirillaceae TaxID=255527 RepID=A0ABV8BH71_9GAMM